MKRLNHRCRSFCNSGNRCRCRSVSKKGFCTNHQKLFDKNELEYFMPIKCGQCFNWKECNLRLAGKSEECKEIGDEAHNIRTRKSSALFANIAQDNQEAD